MTKLSRIQSNIFNRLNIQILRIGKGRWEDNGYVERTHRTDDEEFYIPNLTQIKSMEEHFQFALKWVYTFNTRRAHFGRNMKGKTPYGKLKEYYPWMKEKFYLFPPLILDDISTYEPFIGGQDVLDNY